MKKSRRCAEEKCHIALWKKCMIFDVLCLCCLILNLQTGTEIKNIQQKIASVSAKPKVNSQSSKEESTTQEETQEDITQEGIIQEDITQEGITQEGIIQEDITQEGIIQEDITQEDITQEGIIQEDITQEGITQEGIIQEDITQEDITQEENIRKEKKKIALTFDDGPHPLYTPRMLDGLKERNVKATFFLLGMQVEQYPELVKRISEEGHLIGNHSYVHEQLTKLSNGKACEQINRTNDLIYHITGTYPTYVRPPYGEWKKNLDCELNMIEVFWDIDTLDWSCKNHSKIVNHVVTKIQENDIILMHDSYETTVTATMEIIDTLEKQGYEFVTVDELILE